ncbi:MAG: hypothetical protein HC838_13025 [Spirulinaceae cyanobacterium RM2_2_10]|nr:hypothetical protein [Spirulinaceae cyanobacterium SM2_1_0]NJO20769.1 hypothetical protein [Spirulinaceae cyanobacterium RM2_2_10]
MSSLHPARRLALVALAAIALGASVTPSATAQFLSHSPERYSQLPAPSTTIPAGTRLPLRYGEAEKILLAPGETVPITATVAANIRDSRDRLLIPAGSEVVGEIVPVGEGAQFIAQELIIAGDRLWLAAESGLVTRTETVDQGINTNAVLRNAAIGAGAATLLSGITGDRRITFWEVLGGAGVGAATGLFSRRQAELISIDPNRDLDITLTTNLDLPGFYSR